MPDVEVLVRDDCEHCDAAVETVDRVVDDYSVVDVDESPMLREMYGDVVPVVRIDGVPEFRVWVEEDELRRALEEA